MKKYTPSELLPHKNPMILVDDYITFDAQSISCCVRIDQYSMFLEEFVVPSYVSVEYMAQSIGMWRGLLGKLKNEDPKVGYLVSCRKLTLEKDYFQIGETLIVHCFLKSQIEEMAAFNCQITINGHVVANASINVYQPGE